MLNRTDHAWHRHPLRAARRVTHAQRRHPGLAGPLRYLGALGIAFALPMILGTCFGIWIDQLQPGYSIRATLGGIVIGMLLGTINLYLLMRAHE